MRYKTVKFSNLEIDNLLQEVKDGDIEVTVTEDDIDSGEATAGQVLTADGEGGAEFTDPITYESKPAASGGTDVSLVTTGEKYNWNTKQGFPEASQEDATLAQIAGLNSQGHPDVGKVAAANVNSGSATSGQVLMADGNGGASWGSAGGGGGMSNPMSAAGDIIVGGANGTPTRLAMGTAGQVLKVNAAGTGLEYGAGGSGGGTQLYRHIIRLQCTGAIREASVNTWNTTTNLTNIYLYIINTSSTQITEYGDIINLTFPHNFICLEGMTDSDQYYGMITSYQYLDDLGIYNIILYGQYFYDGTPKYFKISVTGITSDNVMPL